MDWKDIARRAGKTFVQVFLTAFPVTALVELDVPALKVAALAAAAAALAWLWNAALEWSRS